MTTDLRVPDEPKPMGWITPATYEWLKDPSGRGSGTFQPNRNGAYGGVPIYLGEDYDALRSIATAAVALVGERDKEIEELGKRYDRIVDNQKVENYEELLDSRDKFAAATSAAEAECGRLRKDAERYRWLRARKGRNNRWPHISQYPYCEKIDDEMVPQITVDFKYRPDNLDAAIDAALQGGDRG